MLGVLITLLCTHIMPNMYYCSTCMLLYPHLMAKHCLRVGRKSSFFPDLRPHETRQHGTVKVWWRALQSCWECSSLCYASIQCQTSTIVAPACCYTPTWWPNLPESWQKIEIFSWSEAWNPPTWDCNSMVEGPTIMLGVFITLLCIHTMPNIYYCSTCMLLYPHLMAKLAWELAEIEFFSWSEAWNPPTWDCKSMVEGPTIMLRVFITLLCIHTMPN